MDLRKVIFRPLLKLIFPCCLPSVSQLLTSGTSTSVAAGTTGGNEAKFHYSLCMQTPLSNLVLSESPSFLLLPSNCSIWNLEATLHARLHLEQVGFLRGMKQKSSPLASDYRRYQCCWYGFTFLTFFTHNSAETTSATGWLHFRELTTTTTTSSKR